jgi:hypothetical protein
VWPIAVRAQEGRKGCLVIKEPKGSKHHLKTIKYTNLHDYEPRIPAQMYNSTQMK